MSHFALVRFRWFGFVKHDRRIHRQGRLPNEADVFPVASRHNLLAGWIGKCGSFNGPENNDVIRCRDKLGHVGMVMVFVEPQSELLDLAVEVVFLFFHRSKEQLRLLGAGLLVAVNVLWVEEGQMTVAKSKKVHRLTRRKSFVRAHRALQVRATRHHDGRPRPVAFTFGEDKIAGSKVSHCFHRHHRWFGCFLLVQ